MAKQITLETLHKDLLAVRRQIARLCQVLRKDPEGEVADWAKSQLAEARAGPLGNYTSLEGLRKEILAR